MLNRDTNRALQESATVEIDAGIDQLYKFVATDFPENYPKWTPDIISLVALGDGPVTVGSEFRLLREDGGEVVESIVRVMKIKPHSCFSLASLTFPHEMTYSFESFERNRMTKLTFTFHLKSVEMVMRPFVKLIRAALRDGAKQSVENIKALFIENSESVSC